MINDFRDLIFSIEAALKVAKVTVLSFNIDTDTSVDAFRGKWHMCLHSFQLQIEFTGDCEKVVNILEEKKIILVSIATFDYQKYIIVGEIK